MAGAVLGAGPPKILHYGAKWTVPNTTWAWHKTWYHNDFDVTVCPPWDLSAERPSAGLFPYPPRPLEIPSEVPTPATTPNINTGLTNPLHPIFTTLLLLVEAL